MSEIKVVALIKAMPEHRAAVDKAVRAMVARAVPSRVASNMICMKSRAIRARSSLSSAGLLSKR